MLGFFVWLGYNLLVYILSSRLPIGQLNKPNWPMIMVIQPFMQHRMGYFVLKVLYVFVINFFVHPFFCTSIFCTSIFCTYILFVPPFHLYLHFIFTSISFVPPFHLYLYFICISISFVPPFHLYLHCNNLNSVQVTRIRYQPSRTGSQGAEPWVYWTTIPSLSMNLQCWRSASRKPVILRPWMCCGPIILSTIIMR